MKYFLANSLFFVFLLQSLIVWGQEVVLSGKVVDEAGNTVSQVKVSVNGSSFVLSGQDGTFEVSVPPEKAKPREISLSATGYELNTWKNEENEGKSQLIVILKPVSYMLVGKVYNRNGTPMKGATVALEKPEFEETATTNDKGVFTLNIPAYIRISPESVFKVNKTVIEANGLIFEKKGLISLMMPVKTYRVAVYHASNQRLPHFPITIEDKVYETNAQGIVEAKIIDPAKAQYFLEGYTINDKQIQEADLFVHLYAEKKSADAIVDTLLNANLPRDELVEAYAEDFNFIINELELEKQQLINRSTEIRFEMEKIAERLSLEDNLSDEQKEFLQEEMGLLEQALIETDVAYEDAQAKTKKIIDKIKNVIVIKDSINTVAKKQVVEFHGEKVKAEERLETGLYIFLVIAVSLISIILVFYFTGKKIWKQKNELEIVNRDLGIAKKDLEAKIDEVNLQKQEIQQQAEHLSNLNDLISLKNKKMTDNIRYALTVQEAILPSPKELTHYLKDHFITFHPKDIVSGDFYWFSHVITEGGRQKTFIAAVDCTGHGVSGAFMSMIGNTILHEVVNQKHIHEPAQILKELNAGIREDLRQDEKANDDGMDVCLCMLEEMLDGQTKVTFTGAKRPLYYFKAKEGELCMKKGDIVSVGGYKSKKRPFTEDVLMLEQGDALYLSSDGLVDQHNKERDKFGSVRFKNLLTSIATKPMQEQGEILEQTLSNHKGEEEQRDDILVVGVRV